MPSPSRTLPQDVALVLGGGNALGAYLAGICEHLIAEEIRPRRIVGASIGAVTGALLVGNPPEARLDRLREFWAEAAVHSLREPTGATKLRQTYNGLHSALAALAGRPSLFRQRFPGLWSALPWMPNDVALYDLAPLRATLTRLVDFDRLNRGDTRLTVTAVDVETGDEVRFDTADGGIGPDHILASASIIPAFPPVEIAGRLYCDAGYTNNVPLDLVLADPPERDLLCIAAELFSLRAPRPRSLDAVLERAHDLIFASATRRSVAALRRDYALHARLEPDGARATLLHLAYQGGPDEVSAKTLDFSPSSIRDRWAAGRRDIRRGLERLREAAPGPDRLTYLSVPDGAGDGLGRARLP
ncbi:Patatin [Methylobacterium sp. 4-46]|uniref:patatin-like phospholipase family protein n=1 Tax=unclassified Methylobacterium TaxID=2615210 RepID=UPI000152C901|nr:MULTISPECIES: patatin-like phospholipase family protein [Methylobacterium]ACA17003.1 Patatin [Methylobacterium sp. 4-46]WFT82692.1 patatin-like phospholipase family protein [Methylobacterium nodulans]